MSERTFCTGSEVGKYPGNEVGSQFSDLSRHDQMVAVGDVVQVHHGHSDRHP